MHLFQAEQQANQRQYAGGRLRDERRPGHAAHAPFANGGEYVVEQDIGERGGNEKEKGRFRIAERAVYASREVVQNEGGQSRYIDVEIQHALFHHAVGRAEGGKNGSAREKTRAHEHNAQREKTDEGREYAGQRPAGVLSAEIARGEHGAARVGAERHRHQNIDYGHGGAYGGEGAFPCELARDHGVGYGVDLLEYRAAEQRERVGEQDFPGRAHA